MFFETLMKVFMSLTFFAVLGVIVSGIAFIVYVRMPRKTKSGKRSNNE